MDRLPVARIGRNTNKNPKFFCMIILQSEKNKLIRNKSFQKIVELISVEMFIYITCMKCWSTMNAPKVAKKL